MRSRWSILLAGTLLVVSALAAYHNSFGVPFVFDDEPSILDNPSIVHLWPLSGPLSPPRDNGFTVSGRPLLNLTLAINYAISGTNVWSYHALNFLIHALAGLTLFGLVRRTLLLAEKNELPRDLQTQGASLSGAKSGVSQETAGAGMVAEARSILRENALMVAFVISLLWTLHPLQTEAVTYVIQRAESLMGLFYWLTLYCFVRSVDSTRSGAWQVAAVVACLLGAICKEVMATVPVVILLYDRAFVAGNFRQAWRSHRWLYVGLMAVWLPQAWLVMSTGGNRGGTFVLTSAGCRDYWLTQFGTVTRYLQLSLWPHSLIFEHGVLKPQQISEVAPYALLVLGLLAATGWALVKKPTVGFLGAFFFLVLAPTSLLPGLNQVMVEHRMYLPLAAVLTLMVGATAVWLGRWTLGVYLALALAAGWWTERRNDDYQTDLKLWSDTVQKCPGSARAQSGLGTAYYQRANLTEARVHYTESLRLDPQSGLNQYNLGLVLANLDQREEAVAHYAQAVRLIPSFVNAHVELGTQLIRLGRWDEALAHLRLAVGLKPDAEAAYFNLGLVLTAMKQWSEAVDAYEKAIKLKPDDAVAENNLGEIRFRMKQIPESILHLERALRLKPDLADAHYNLGLAFAAAGRPDDALAQYTEAVRLVPAFPQARLNLGIMLAQRNRLNESWVQLSEAVRLQPGSAEAHANLGMVLAEMGRVTEAIASDEEALRLRPDYAVAHYNLGNALVGLQRWPEAERHFAEALRLAPDFVAAREMLDRLRTASPAR